MLYLSSLLNKTVYLAGKPFGKIVDMAVLENRPHPPVCKFEIRKANGKKLTVSPQAVVLKDNRFFLTSQKIPFLPYDHNDFYLNEDLLDKQVIDTDGKRLVRVNDVLLDQNGEMKVIGIDVGLKGVFRRLGLNAIRVPSKVLPWEYIEAFDYDTGSIKIKLNRKNLSALHPADIADLLEEAGSKERLGIVKALEPNKAARAIEESDQETQASILDQLTSTPFREIVAKMHISEIADVFKHLKPEKIKELQMALGQEKTQKVKKILHYPSDVAGGLMRLSFFWVSSELTVKQTFEKLKLLAHIPEVIILLNAYEKFSGFIKTKDLIQFDSLTQLKNLTIEKKFIYPSASFSDIMKIFSQYNLHTIPVVDKEKKPVGLVVIDDLLKFLEEEDEKYEAY